MIFVIKSIKTLTIRNPSRPEGRCLFFFLLLWKDHLQQKIYPINLKQRFFFFNLLSDKASNAISYISVNELSDNDEVKKIVLREFEPTAQCCLEQFRKTIRQSNETHRQFASRLTTSFDYHLKLRKVSNFDKLKQLSCFRFWTKKTATQTIRFWFDPMVLTKEADLFFVSRGKSLTDINNQNILHKCV